MFFNNRIVAAPLAQRPFKPGPRVGTDGLGQYKITNARSGLFRRVFLKNLNPISSYINFSQHKPEYSEIYYLIAAQFPYAAVDYYLLSLDLSNGLLKQDELTLFRSNFSKRHNCSLANFSGDIKN